MKALLALAMAVGLACAGPARAIVVDFESETTGAQGSPFTSGALTFSSSADIFIVPFITQELCPSTGGNCALDLHVDFAFPVQNLTFTVSGANSSASVLDATVNFAGGGSTLLSFTGFTVGLVQDLLSFGALSDIISLDITEDDGGGFNYDNFTFDAVAVTEPAAWAMLVVGCAVVGGTLRRRASRRAFSSAAP